MKRCVLTTLTTVFTILLAVSTSVHGAPVTFSFSASVTSSDLVGTPFGSAVTGSFTFEGSAPDSDPSAMVGLYDSALTHFHFMAGPYSASLAADFVPGIHGLQVFNDDPDVIAFGLAGDALIAFAQVSPIPPLSTPGGTGLGFVGFSLQLIDPTEQAFASDALPLTPPDLSQFSFRQIILVFAPLDGNGPGRQLSAAIDGMTLVPVPVPGAIALLAAGLFGLVRLRPKIAVH